MKSKKAVMALVATSVAADNVVGALLRGGIAAGDISVIFSEKTGATDFSNIEKSMMLGGAESHTAAGYAVGSALGLLAGIGMVVFPGIGPFIAVGPILTMLGDVAAGAALGGFAAALVGLGIPDHHAANYEGAIQNGEVMLSLHLEDQAQRSCALDILESSGAQHIVVIGEDTLVPPTLPEAPTPGATK